MSRVLAIDYGERRIGLAVSDPLRIAAHGMPTMENRSPEEVMDSLRRIVDELSIEEIVVGLPLNMDGSEGEQAAKARSFAERLKPLGRPVRLLDERLTTERAHRAMREAGLSRKKRRRRADRLAAQFILQSYLARRGTHREDDEG